MPQGHELVIRKLQVEIEGKTVVRQFSLTAKEGEVVVIMGPNGSGKSSLANALAGSGGYGAEGEVIWGGKNILQMSLTERAREGLFLAYQNPISIPGVKVFTFLKAACEAQGKKIEGVVQFRRELEKLAERVGLSKEHIGRSVNEGFSGGERKRLEMLQLLLLRPRLVILDEIDSGLDIDALKMVGEVVGEMNREGTMFLVITHYQRLLAYVRADRVLVMKGGVIVKMGGKELIEQIEEGGYGQLPTAS